MSDYYEYVVNCEFPMTLAPHILEILRYMVRKEEYAFQTDLTHPLFESEEISDGEHYEAWRGILQTDPGGFCQVDSHQDSGYFARFFQAGRSNFTSSDASYMLSFRMEVHDDAEGEIWKLLQWLATISDSRGFVGYSIRQGHEVSEHPTLWYFENNQLVSRR